MRLLGIGSLVWSHQVPSSKTKVEGELEETEGSAWLADSAWLAEGAIQRTEAQPSNHRHPQLIDSSPT